MRYIIIVLVVFFTLATPARADTGELIARIRAERNASMSRWNALLADLQADDTPQWNIAEHYPRPVITGDIGHYGQRRTVEYGVWGPYDHDGLETTLDVVGWHQEEHKAPVGGEIFTWDYSGELADDEYFQVMLICPNGEHRGIHTPTKDRYTIQGGSLRYIVQDCKGVQTRALDYGPFEPTQNIDIQYTVAVVKWSGEDPSIIGPILAEAEPEWIKI